MANLTQTGVGKSRLNSLIAEGLLEIIWDLIPVDFSRIPYKFPSMEWWIYKMNKLC